MAANNSNRISAVLTDAQITALRTAISTIESTLPFLIGLTSEERKSMPKISDANKTFTEDASAALLVNPELFPVYVKPAELANDLKLYQQLDEFVQRIAKFSEKLTDTQSLAGSEAYVSALTVYRLAESAANAGVAGADTLYNQLRNRFAEQGNASKQAAAINVSPN